MESEVSKLKVTHKIVNLVGDAFLIIQLGQSHDGV
jgi:hypothetical protein